MQLKNQICNVVLPWFLEYENETLESKNDKTGGEKKYREYSIEEEGK